MDNPETEPEGPGDDRAAAEPETVDGSGAPHSSPQDQAADASVKTPGDAPARPGAGLRWGMVVAALLAVVAVVAAIVGLVRWVGADSGGSGAGTSAAADDERPQIITDASQALLNLSTFDSDEPDLYLDDLRSSVTGELAGVIDELSAANEAGLDDEVHMVLRPRLHSITLSSYDPDAGEASVVAMMATDVVVDDERVNIRRRAVSLDMERVDGVWKAGWMTELFIGDEVLPGYAPGADVPGTDGPESEGPR